MHKFMGKKVYLCSNVPFQLCKAQGGSVGVNGCIASPIKEIYRQILGARGSVLHGMKESYRKEMT